MSKKVFWTLCGLLVFYGTATTLFSAWTEGYVHDEPMYVEIGQWMNQGQHPEPWWGHPPLAIWTGSALPTILGAKSPRDPWTLFLARQSHVWLACVVGITIAFLILRHAGERASLLFLLLYNTFGGLKFVASHHLTDADSTLFAALALVCVWAKPPRRPLEAAPPLFFISLAFLSKISMILVAPFVVYGCVRNIVNVRSLMRMIFVGLGALLLGLGICYRFRFGDFWQFFHILKLQMGRAAGGSPNSLWGQRVDEGVWYYYLVVSVFKTPVLVTALVGLGTIASLKKPLSKEPWIFFAVPACVVFFVFSRSSLQLGVRYITLSFLLMYIFAAVILSTRGPRSKAGWVLVACALVALDFYTVCFGSYQTYFNFLTPRPATHFAESNIDWHQSIPRHLQEKAPKSIEVREYLDFLLDPAKESTTFRTTAMELNGIWHHPVGVLLRALKPRSAVAGYEFHSVSKEMLFHLLNTRRPFHATDTLSFKQWDVPREPASLCKALDQFQVGAKEILPLQELLRKIPENQSSWETRVPVEWAHPGRYLLLVESSGAADIAINGRWGKYARGSMEEFRHFSFWMPIELKSQNEIIVQFTKKGPDLNRNIEAKIYALEAKCLPRTSRF